MTLVEDLAAHGQASRPVTVSLMKDLLPSSFREERILAVMTRDPISTLRAMLALARGTNYLPIAAGELVPAALPYRQETLAQLRHLKELGRTLYLVGDGNEGEARAIAEHLGLFDGVLAGGTVNSAWAHEPYSDAIPGRASRSAIRQLLGAWVRELRPHQWVKNVLVAVPLVVGQHFAAADFIGCIMAFIALSLCASSVYVVNDIADLPGDRAHPTKRFRPIAAGLIPVRQAIFAAPLLAAAGLTVAILTSGPLAALMVLYLAGSLSYTFYFKRKIVLDAVLLAGLYVLRVLAGALAADVDVSEWLLSFSALFFFALALVKRQIEYRDFDEAQQPTSSRRYAREDAQVLAALAAGAGANAVTVFCLYATSPESKELYSHPILLFLAAPVLLYWLSRLILLANRGLVHDDPVLFAIRDRSSIACAVLMGVTLLAAK